MEDFSSDSQIHANTIRPIFSLVILLFIFTSYSQDLSTSNKKAHKLYEKADKAYKERDFDAALAFLEQAGKLDTTFFEAYIRMGSLYNALGKVDSVYVKFEHYVRVAPNPAYSVLEKMAFMSFDMGHYQRSKEYLERFLKEMPNKRHDKEIQLLKNGQDFALEETSNADKIVVTELPNEINRFDLQYLPAMTVDGATLIFTKRDVVSDDEDIVVSYLIDETWTAAESISSKINTPLNEGACTVSANGRMLIFTACDRKDSYGSCDLFVTKKTGDQWSKPKNLGKTVNSKYWESQPSLSSDGNTLYFVSNRPGGIGGRDIWVTQKMAHQWSTPINLGKTINTFKDETTPFIHFNGESLFFSSNGYPGMGGFDLFKSERSDTDWTKPINLGYPINTFRDEVALLIEASGVTGYFAKEIQKGQEILDSKIVSFAIPEPIRPLKSSYVVGSVVEEKSNKPLKAAIQVVDLITGDLLYHNFSDSLTGEFYMVLPTNKELGGYVKKKGYLYEDLNFMTGSIKSDSLLIKLAKVEVGESLILQNIYFETNSYKLNEKSKVEISNAVGLLRDNPSISIQIAGHTDDIGEEAYNLSLSERRAKEVYEILIKEGINKMRLTYKGFGASRPILPNNSDINRQSNRRIEFFITGTD